jgi:ferritin-like metal-binding protein YciE
VDAHRTNSHKHRAWLVARLEALGALPPPDGRAGAPILAAAGGLARVHPDASEEQRLSQAVLMKQLEVATYDTVERLAKRAGDDATARVARDARRDDEELTRRLLRRRLRARREGVVTPRIAPAR